MQIYGAKINHLTNPLGFRMVRTVFSWKVKEAVGQQPTAARICVAADPQMKTLLADSGWDEKADSLAYPVALELRPRTRYYWTVAVKSDAGEQAQSDVQWFETAKCGEAWAGKWITCDSLEQRHPWFEKAVAPAASKQLARARLYISGLGLYEAYYNGQRIGNEYFTPYCNDYNEWVQYQTFDVTEAMKAPGTLSVLLGNGWYKGRFGFAGAKDRGFYGNEWKLIAELRLEYADGTEDVIGTDESWTVRRSRITFSNLYDGEHRDDTLPDMPPEKAALCEAPKGALTERMSLPVTAHETMAPVALLRTPAGEDVFDLGQEITGLFALKVHEPAGTKIHIQTGEILQGGNFYNANLRSAKSEYFYVSDGAERILIPHFTFYGYRYVKVEGLSHPHQEDLKGIALYSDMETTGRMTTGHALINRFIENVRWGMQDNFLDVPTDCPQRDERMGWTGDAQVFSATATYLKDTYAFYAKYLHDMLLEQRVREGKVPDVVPSCGVESTATVWGDASCIIPWNLYLFYGDKSILEDQFDSMKGWVDYIRKVDGNNHGWRYVFHYGDWLSLDNPEGGIEQTMGATDEEFIANLYYAVSAGLVANAAAVLGRLEEEKAYRALSEEQFAIVKKEYYSATGRCCIKTQTALILTLKYHLSQNEALIRQQLAKLFRQSHKKLRTGFVGTPLLCNVLTDNGMADLAYELLLNEDYPGWLYEVKLGATTVWERWNSLLADGTISGISMNSMNHYAYGAVLEWMFRHVAGINTVDAAPGLKKAVFMPLLNWRLRSVEAAYDSASGEYASSWSLPDPQHVSVHVSVPFGCSAELILPLAGEEVYQDAENPMFAHVENGICHLAPGKYSVTYALTRSLKEDYSLDTPIGTLLGDPEAVKVLNGFFPVSDLPNFLLDRSIREIAKGHSGRISREQLELLDAKLRAI